MSAQPKTTSAKFVNPKHTVEYAARQAAMRNCYLRVYWTFDRGLRVVAVRRQTSSTPPEGLPTQEVES